MMTKLPVEKVRRTVDLSDLTCESSKDAVVSKSVIGQERAVRALQFGLGITSLGFNIYVAGLPGTGRTTAARRFLESLAKDKPVPPDYCYVNNFRETYHPKAISLPAGRGQSLRQDMKELVDEARREIRRVFESDEYAAKREQTVKAYQQKRNDTFLRLGERAQQQGFSIQATPMGLVTVPLKDGKPLDDEAFMSLESEEKERILSAREQLQEELKTAVRQARSLEKGANEELQTMDQEAALFAISPMIDELKETYGDVSEVISYLDEVQADILDNLDQFRSEQQEGAPTAPRMPGAQGDPFKRYEVNVLVDNADLSGAPVLIELNPTYNDLFGRIEKEAQFGALTTDFTLIRHGALHRANGGFLVIPVEELLRNPWSWDGLKRALRNKSICIEEPAERMGFLSTKSLRPESIPLDIKVILIGQPLVYNLMYALDEDFRELFKVKADFDSRMERSQESIHDYVAFVCAVCEGEKLRHLDRSALVKLVEHGARLADHQDKLSTLFGEISDVIREADYYAGEDGSSLVSGRHVTKAVEEKFYRSGLVAERMRELVARGVIKIDVDGQKVGQVNGLSVIGLGEISFGHPNRITASISLGQDGILDIEREAKLGGPIHTKGVMILSGYLSDKYAQDKPLSMTARLVFEQSYSGVEGDSASSTELYAILSSLSGLPLRQDLAVTGSVNQKGEVQAIGGANEKVEGFFEVCRLVGLTGDQGVLIPTSNVQNLMLKEEVVEAVRDGRFHIWPISTIDEGIEVLTGVPAGRRLEDGTWEEGYVNDLVDRQLGRMSQKLRHFSRRAEEKSTEGEND